MENNIWNSLSLFWWIYNILMWIIAFGVRGVAEKKMPMWAVFCAFFMMPFYIGIAIGKYLYCEPEED